MAQMDDQKSKPDVKNVDAMWEEYKLRHKKFEKNIRPFPIDSNSIFNKKLNLKHNIVHRHMTQTYPIVHGGVLSVVWHFLALKCKFGTPIEQKLYANMSITQFFHRIFTKRALVFYQKYDSFLLRNRRSGAGKWENVGVETSASIPALADYLSYDELLISALCGVSSPTHFINAGSRVNSGRFDPNNKLYPMEAVYMGLIGARFEKMFVMEYALMIVHAQQNEKERGYGKYERSKIKNEDKLTPLQKSFDAQYFLSHAQASNDAFKAAKPSIFCVFEFFYNRSHFPLYDEISSNAKNQQIYFEDTRRFGANKPYLDMQMFAQRIRVSLELFLFDSDYRCKLENQKGFCHLVGLGAGYWSFAKTFQDVKMCDIALQIIADSD